MEYLLHILTIAAIYSTVAVSLDLLVGQTGLLSLSHAAFFGIGAYISALTALRLGYPFVASLTAAIVGAVLLSFAVSLPSLRLYGDYFVIITFGFQMIVFNVLNNWVSLTGGPLGVPGIPQPSFFGWTLRARLGLAVLAVLVAFFGYVAIDRVSNSPFGRVLRAIREDEPLARALGKDTFRFKASAFALSAALAAMGGVLYAHYLTFIDPTSFTVMESILVIAMVIIGGAGSPWGPVVGAALLVVLPEALRFAGLPGAVAAHLRQIFYGTLIVLMMLLRPSGLVGRYRLGR
jgi:branched-chain amino acid transport system permease protein